MKIEQITIENLTSFKGRVTVDFTAEPLRSAGLFAITGDTGAGKTTLLDAVCLALYNRAPRLDVAHKVKRDTLTVATGDTQAIQPTESKIFLRKGEKQGHCAVVFTVQDGSRWEATWSIRLRRTGTYDTPQQTLRCLSPRKTDIPSGEIARTVVHIVGLDYNQFTRTVLLAQNSFASFLRAKDEEKSALLEKLTGTEIYASISQQIHSLCRDAKEQVEQAKSRLGESQRDIIPEEELEKVKSQCDFLNIKLRDLQLKEKEASAGLQWFANTLRKETLVRQAEEAHDRANKTLTAHRNEEKALQVYDEISPLKGCHQNILNLRHDIEHTQDEEATLSRLLEASTKRYDVAKMQSKQSEEQLDEAKSLLRDRSPIINQGKEFLHKMDSQQRNVKSATEAYERLREQRQKREEEEAELIHRLETTSSLLASRREDRQKLAVHQQMFDNHDVVIENLKSFQEDTAQDERDSQALIRFQDQAEQAKKLSIDTAAQLQKAEERIASLSHEISIQRRHIMGQDGELLQEKQNRLTRRIALLEGAQTLWRNLSALYETLAEARTEVRRKHTELSQLDKDLISLNTRVEVLTEEYENRHNAFVRSNSESIINLRKELKEGQPCPVCGSAHHPYHTETEQELGRLKNQIEEDFEEARQRLTAATQQRNETQQNRTAVEQAIFATERSVRNMEQALAQNEKAWQQYATLDASFLECSPSVNAAARHTTLLALIDSTQRDANETADTLRIFNHSRLTIDHLLKDHEEARNKRDALSKAHNEQLQAQNVALAQAKTLHESRKTRGKRIAYLYQDLERSITLSNWYNNWMLAPEEFRRQITDLYLRWTELNSGIAQGEIDEGRLREQIKGATNNVHTARINERTSRDTLANEQKILENYAEEYRRIFPEISPDTEQSQLNARIEAAEQVAQKAQAELSLLEQSHSALLGRQQALEKRRQDCQERLRQEDTALHQWLSTYNGTHEVLLPQQIDAIFADARDWNALRQMLTDLRNAVTQTKAHLDAAQNDLLEHHRHPDRPQKDDSQPILQELLERTTKELKEENQRFILLNNRLSAHNKALERSAQIVEELQQVEENAQHWIALDSVFGSADGKRFRELAQSFTFATLVEQANRHLATLSPRYVLRTLPGTLTLEILDRDLLDTQRYVSSLSGGETFIVSLALALGLASLSSHNLHIESLFIDEGFGNLDATSLDLVMAALGHLESTQGRKVGIISHTEQIRSQISPQINVVKSPTGGYSTIMVE